MTDFLTRLVDRALDRGPKLDRRTPSRFERAAAAAPLDVIAVAVATERPAASTRVRATTDAPPTPRAADVSQRGAAPPAPAPRLAPVADSVVVPPEVRRADATTPVPPATPTRIETRHTERQTFFERKDVHTIERFETIREPRIVERERVIERLDAPPVAAPVALQPDATVAAPGAEARVIIDAGVRAQSIRYEKAAAQDAARAPAPGSSRAVHEMEHLDAPVPPPSTITVSIGRVEIRSTTPPGAPVREGRAAAPKVPLDEYLQRRTTGGA
jgi:hypothetical protein